MSTSRWYRVTYRVPPLQPEAPDRRYPWQRAQTWEHGNPLPPHRWELQQQVLEAYDMGEVERRLGYRLAERGYVEPGNGRMPTFVILDVVPCGPPA